MIKVFSLCFKYHLFTRFPFSRLSGAPIWAITNPVLLVASNAWGMLTFLALRFKRYAYSKQKASRYQWSSCPCLSIRKTTKRALLNWSSPIGSARASAVPLFSPSHKRGTIQPIGPDSKTHSFPFTMAIEEAFIYQAPNAACIQTNAAPLTAPPVQSCTPELGATPLFRVHQRLTPPLL